MTIEVYHFARHLVNLPGWTTTMGRKHHRRRSGPIPEAALKRNGEPVDRAFLRFRADRAAKNGFPKAKWIEFCEVMLDHGYALVLYEARQTVSKYVTVSTWTTGEYRTYKVRFSDHRPNRDREVAGSCDFFVGKTHLSWTTTTQAIAATLAYLKPPDHLLRPEKDRDEEPSPAPPGPAAGKEEQAGDAGPAAVAGG